MYQDQKGWTEMDIMKFHFKLNHRNQADFLRTVKKLCIKLTGEYTSCIQCGRGRTGRT